MTISELALNTMEYLDTEEGKRCLAGYLLVEGLSFECALSMVVFKVPGASDTGTALDVTGFLMDALHQRKTA